MSKPHVVIIVFVLLCVMAAVNYVGDPIGNDDEPGPVVEEPPPATESMVDERMDLAPPPKPIGPADAPVTLEVFCEVDNDCHEDVQPGALALAVRCAPYVRLLIRRWNAEGTKTRADQLGTTCLAAVAITTEGEGEDCADTELLFTGPPGIGGWTWDDVAIRIHEKLLEAGIEVSLSDIMLEEPGAYASEAGEDANDNDPEAP